MNVADLIAELSTTMRVVVNGFESGSDVLKELENRTWAERNAEALAAHGTDISATGLAGAEFDRI